MLLHGQLSVNAITDCTKLSVLDKMGLVTVSCVLINMNELVLCELHVQDFNRYDRKSTGKPEKSKCKLTKHFHS